MAKTRPILGTYTPDMLSKWDTISALAKADGDIVIQLADAKITLPTQLAIMNGLLWDVLLEFKVQPDLQHVYFPDRDVNKETGHISYSFTSDTIFNHLNDLYNELILKYNVEPYMNVVATVFKCIQRFSIFADVFTREYQVTLDMLRIAKLCAQKPMKDIVTRKIDGSHGTKYAEKQFEAMTNDLMNLLADPSALKYNPLLPFMLTKLLKRNQVPQMFGAYGTRSDIDDSMKKHVINESANSGLLSIKDYATESLSAKKAAFFNNAVIRKAQYFARRCRLAASKISKLYRGSCGSEVTIPFVIHSKYKKNFIGKFVRVDEKTRHLLKDRVWPQYPNDDSVELTKQNIDLFVDREIQMWSPFGCKYTDGVCEHCAGCMHQKLHAYIPDNIWLGVYLTTFVVSSVTQKILSAKHLIKTSSKEFILPADTQKFIDKSGDALLWTKAAAKGIKGKNLFLRLEQSSFLGPLGDLSRKVLPSGQTFTKIARMALVDVNGHVLQLIELTDGTTYPYLSGYGMYYFSKHFKDIRIDQDYVDIPMNEFDFNKAILKFTAVNDDMVSYVDRIDSFVSKGVSEYTNISACLDKFSSLIYDKTDVHIFPIEVMLRSYLASADTLDIPVITDPHAPVRFCGQDTVISGAALSTKLAFQGMNELFRNPDPTMQSIGCGEGYYDLLFAFADVK